MSRINSNPVRKYFVYNEPQKKSLCQIHNCGAELAGNHAANLERHIQRLHKKEHEILLAAKKGSLRSARVASDQAAVPSKMSRMTSSHCISDGLFSTPLKVKLDANTVISACMELVTVNGWPYRLLDDSGFRTIMNPIEKSIGKDFRVSAEFIRSKVPEVAGSVRESLKLEAAERLVSLKVDCATWLDRSVIGINMQFIESGKIVLRNLAIKELQSCHTSLYLKSMILEVLDAYNITLKQVYSVTTDNGANLMKSVKLLEQESQAYSESEDELDQHEAFCCRTTSVEQPTSSRQNVSVENPASELILDTIDLSEDTARPLTSTLRGVRCAARSLQLAVDDALKESATKEITNMARSVVKRLKDPSMLVMLRKLKLKMPILDCVTRWHTTCDMLKRLLELRSFCQDMATSNIALFLSESEWATVTEIIHALEPARQTAKMLQLAQLTLGDFYGFWIKLYLQISNMPRSSFVEALQSALEKRERMLLDDDAFRACIYLDPRYKVLLSQEDKQKAKVHLQQTWVTLRSILPTGSKNDTDAVTAPESTSSSDDDFELLLKARDLPRGKQGSVMTSEQIASALELFQDEPRIGKEENVLRFWEQQRKKHPELYSLAQVVFAVPATQVSVERAFARLKFVLSRQRSNMTDCILEDIDFIRVNKPHGL